MTYEEKKQKLDFLISLFWEIVEFEDNETSDKLITYIRQMCDENAKDWLDLSNWEGQSLYKILQTIANAVNHESE